MKRRIAFIIVLCLCVALLGCQTDRTKHEVISDYETGYEEGYAIGYDTGLWDGVFEAQEDIASAVLEAYSEMEGQTTKERGLHPEEAILVLKDYMNGEYVSAEELETAIRSITYFYYHAWDVINGIDDMDVDFDFD